MHAKVSDEDDTGKVKVEQRTEVSKLGWMGDKRERTKNTQQQMLLMDGRYDWSFCWYCWNGEQGSDGYLTSHRNNNWNLYLLDPECGGQHNGLHHESLGAWNHPLQVCVGQNIK